MKTPFGWLAERYTLSPRVLRLASTIALIMSILIVLGGGIVRVTGSGLGCPTWPECDATSLAPTPALGIHGIIEFTNRLLTDVLCLAVAFVIVAARLQKPRVRSITRLAWSQFWLVVANAVIGGISVLAKLNPYVVAGHFLMAIALLTTTALTWHRVHEAADAARRRSTPVQRWLSWAILGSTIVVLALGTLVTGSGPHSGQAPDESPVARMHLDWAAVTTVHGVFAVGVLVLGIALWAASRGPGASVQRRRAIAFVAVVTAQAILGIVQALTYLPNVLVILHVVGSALVWVGALRVLLDVNPELFPGVHVSDASQSPAAQAHLVDSEG